MNLKRLLELSKAQADGKTIMCHEVHSGYMSSFEKNYKVDIDEVDFQDFIEDDMSGISKSFYIDGEESYYGRKLTKQE